MYTQNDNTKVTLVVHSMGGPVSLYFLTSGIVTQEWKDTYINSYITLAGAWSGGNRALLGLVSGLFAYRQELLLFFEHLFNQLLRPIFRSMQSAYWMLPRASVWNSTVLISTPSRNYTASDYEALFNDIGYSQGYMQFNGIQGINVEWPAPNVSTFCFYGVGLKTDEVFVYDDGFPNDVPTRLIKGDGDGTVNLPSSEVCLRWANSGYPFNRTTFEGVEHLAIVSNVTILKTIGSIVGAPVDPIDSAAIAVTLVHYSVMFASLVMTCMGSHVLIAG